MKWKLKLKSLSFWIVFERVKLFGYIFLVDIKKVNINSRSGHAHITTVPEAQFIVIAIVVYCKSMAENINTNHKYIHID